LKFFYVLDVKIIGKILIANELAECLNPTEMTIYKYVNEGKIPGFKVGSSLRFDKD